MRKRRILSLLTALALCLSLLPVTALAEGTECGGTECGHVAAIGNIHYSSLADAIAAVQANGAETTITLLQSFSTTSFEIPLNKNITLDLNGCELDLGEGQYGITVKGGSILTLQDGSSAKTGCLSFCVNEKKGAVVFTDAGSARFNLKSGAIKATTSLTGDFFYGVRFLGTLDLAGGSVTATTSGNVEPIAVGMTGYGKGGTINCDLSAINTFKTKGIALEVATNVSPVVINGGTFTGSQYSIESKSGLTVNGGTFDNIYASRGGCSGSSFSSCTINGTLTLGSNECTFEHVTFGTDAQLSSTLYKLTGGQVVSTDAPKITFATNDADMGLIKIDNYNFSDPSSSGGFSDPMESKTWYVNSGSTATVTATAVPADENHEFVGWYDANSISGTKISSEKTVTYTAPEGGVMGNVSYYAVFQETEEYAGMKEATEAWASRATITSVADMGYFAYAVNELGMDFSGKTVTLEADLTYTDANSFTPIGTADNHFAGTFDGCNHTITGLSYSGTYGSDQAYGFAGLFGYVADAEIQNLTLSGVNFFGGYAIGGFAGEANRTTFTNCTLTGGSKVSYAYYTGGLFGHSSGGCTVTGCTVENSVLDGNWKTGGITGYADGVTISGTTVNNTEVKGTGVGALIGHANAGDTELIDVMVAGVKNETGEKTLVIGTTYAGGDSHSITVSGDSTNMDAAGLVPSDSKSNVQVSGGDFTFVIPDEYVPGSTDKISVTFKNGEEIVIVHVISHGGTVTLPAEPTKDNYNFEGWYVDNTEITGETTFTVNTVVNAQWSEIPVANVTLNQYNLSLFVGGTATLTATVGPENATDKTVTWESDDETVATVEDGVVTAIDEGTATITAKAGDKMAVCEVTVIYSDVTSVTLNESSLSLAEGGSATLTATVLPASADQTVTWSSSNEAVASVDENGVVTAVSEGTATITATAGGKTATCTVTVTNEGAVLPAVEESKPSVSGSITDEGDKKTASVVAESVVADNAISSATQSAANSLNNSSEKEELISKGKEELNPTGDQKVSLYTQTYLTIEATKLEKDDSNEVTSITLDITPMMRVVASTATNSADVVLEEGDEKNAVEVKPADKLTVTTAAQITVTLPGSFYGKTVFVKHEASNGGIYFYQATADEDGKLTFTSYHGFSPFTFSLTNEAVAEVNGVGYLDFQEAVDAVQDSQTITVYSSGLSATVSGNKTFYVALADGVSQYPTLTAADGYVLLDNGEGTYTVYKRPVSSGGVTPPTHDISVDSGNHGDVEIWPEEAKQGTTVTITATPDKGYEVADVTVTAENGKEITVTDKGNNKYTFTMPNSDVTIEVTFQPVSESAASGGDLTITAPAGWVNPYTDVAASDWFYNAVGYATANGLMGGVGNNAFDPSGTMNRAMVWTVIARLAGQTISGANWADDARTWAMAQGVSDGTNPDGAVSREELVTMLYRYAGSPEMNVPELALIGNYPDSADVSGWAESAFAWAISKGIIEGRDGKLAAGDSITRAEAATILARFHLLTK